MAGINNRTSEPSDAKIQAVIAGILKEGELSQLTSRTVRLQIERKFGVSLVERKKEIDKMLMEMIMQKTATGHEEEEENERERNNEIEDENGYEEKGRYSSDDSSSEDEDPAPKKRKHLRGTTEGNSGMKDAELAKRLHLAENGRCPRRSTKKQSDEDPAPNERRHLKGTTLQLLEKATKTKTNRKNGGFAKKLVLSPLLAEVVGHERMSRCEVVKSIWKVIKERKLEDPENMRYAVCDEQFEQLFGIKRFKTFSMMKYLQKHMKDPNY
ncbi:uncharacterized protein [Acropora muricata]|uniref:uncharacterized protein isoform X2 n=1 Tax=Acropora muricata TaxID=159855 RepID=UPI0034E40FBA